MCEAWQRNRMQHLWKMGKNAGPILSRLWTKVHEGLRLRRRPIAVFNALARMSISCFTPNIMLNVPLSCEVVEKSDKSGEYVVLGPEF